MGKGGSGKSSKGSKGSKSSSTSPWKTNLKDSSPWRSGGKSSSKGSSKGKSSSGSGGGKWVFVEEPARRKGGDKGKGKSSKGKGKGKGKGKFRAAPLNSSFWSDKLEEEGRQEQGDTDYPGVISMYRMQNGWGFILPDNPESLPKQVKKKIKESEDAAKADGKEVKEKGMLYFRKPDVNHAEGFKLAAETAVTFKVYVDEKGAGAYDVSPA
eukprot:TRINITY_DN385_c0_g2_i1.p1 TRINITY_DN385_c0_g2~~TRINITY_DN385_c0_g2_i1.p1  ORF type:complete len:211 (-),score=72.47 TRINITY_DN385_c0_g2_i1:49-681(-)